jgi:hypothetical protein
MHDTLGLDVPCVRHPAKGGATEFTRGVQALLRGPAAVSALDTVALETSP